MNKKINVLFDATVLANGVGKSAARSGVYFVAYNILLEMLKREELNVSIYCNLDKIHQVIKSINSDENLVNISMFKNTKLGNLIGYWETVKYENKVNKGNKIVRVFIKTILNFFKFIFDVKNKLNMNHEYERLFDDIDVFFSSYCAILPEIKKIKHIKKYTILYDIIPLIFPEYYPDIKDKTSWFLKLVNSINKDDYYFAISEHTKNDFIKHVSNIDPAHIITIPLSTGLKYEKVQDSSKIDKVKEKYNIPKDKKYLFSLCTLEPRKNLIFAVKNFVEFIKRNNINDFVFVLGGGHWEFFIQKMDETIEDLKDFKDKIIKIGYVDDEDMSALYSGAEVFTFPSIYEGFGMPILEAMQCGCPVITSSVTSMPEVIGDCGIQINPKEDEDLIKAFEKMYFDKSFKKECSKKGLERAKMFNWEKCADVIIMEMCKNEKSTGNRCYSNV